MKRQRLAVWMIALLAFVAWPATSAPGAPKEAPAKSTEPSTESLSITRHSMMLDGKPLEYTATAGYLPLKNDQGKLEANIFFIAYTLNTGAPSSSRPVTFAFNGGPGAAALWLHLGGLGPKRVVMEADGTVLAKNSQLTDNEATWLDQTDLVFVDPVGAGFSRAAEGSDAKRYWEVNEDIRTTARFIRLYVTQFERWLSPVYLAGESYGTMRIAGAANRLQSDYGLYPRGVIMISTVLDFQTISPSTRNDLPYVLGLPSCAASAWYHKKLPPERQATEPNRLLSEVESWARGEYLTALAKGDALTKEEKDRIARQLASFTGLPRTTILNNRLRISTMEFSRELLRDSGQFLGFMDGRVMGIATSGSSEWEPFDPSFFLAIGPFVATFNDYVRRELKFVSNLNYEFLSREAHGAWKWNAENRYIDLSGDLAQAMSANIHLKLFNAAGIYDLTTPYFAQHYSLDHLGLNERLRGNITCQTYLSGHQIYTSQECLRKLKADVAAFMKQD